MADSVTISAPRGEVSPTGYIPRYILPFKRLSHGQGKALKRLLAGLRESGATFTNGRPVRDRAEAVAWLLEQLEKEGDHGPESDV